MSYINNRGCSDHIRTIPDWYWHQMVAGGFQQGEEDNESYLFMDTSEPEVLCTIKKHRGRPIKGYCYSPDDAGEVG